MDRRTLQFRVILKRADVALIFIVGLLSRLWHVYVQKIPVNCIGKISI